MYASSGDGEFPRGIQQRGGIWVLGSGEHRAGAALLHDPASTQHDKPVTRALRESQVMGDVQH
ncbi:MAG: hypothetical protein ACRDSH_21695, partial [Pseudonocardiaceae bacterium]